MFRLIILGIFLWLALFSLRVFQVGGLASRSHAEGGRSGLNPSYQEPAFTTLKPLQQKLAETCKKLLPKDQGMLLAGMLVGSNEKLSFGLKNDLKNTSTIHIIVVSGQNLTILAGFIMNLASFLGRKKTITITLLLLGFYSLLTGFAPPVVRAVLMVGATFMAQLWGKEVLGWWVLSLTVGLMLLYQPNYLFNISFQLTVAATVGVVVVAPLVIRKIYFVPKILREDLGVSLAAQLLTLPIIAFYFQRVSVIGILTNALVLWTVTPVMVIGFLSLGVGLISLWVGQVIALVPSILLTYFIYIVKFFGNFPGSSLELGQTSWVLWLGYYLIIGAMVWGLSFNQADA